MTDTYVEWRVTGDPDYDFTWSPIRNPDLCKPDAETAARRFAGHPGFQSHMTNIRVLRRSVTITPWEDA